MAKKRNYIRLTEEELKTAVHESVLKILLEKSGISDEVVEATNQVVDELFKIDFKGLNWQWFVINDMSLIWPYKSIRASVSIPNVITIPGFDSINGFEFTLINFAELNDINLYGSASGIGGDFNFASKIIKIIIPCINQMPLKGNVYSFLSHELNHAYQDKLKGNEITSASYVTANRILSDKNNYTPEEVFIAQLIYRLNPREIDANAHSLFLQLCGQGDYIHKMEDLSELDNYPYIQEVKAVKNRFVRPYLIHADEYSNVLRERFGIKGSTFTSYVKKYIAYMERKVRQVVGLYFTISNKGKITTEETKKLDSWQNLVR